MSRISPEEIIWTLAALPGLVLWVRNRMLARRTLNDVNLVELTNGRRLWARFALALTTFFICAETVFLIIGVVAMMTADNPDQNPPRRLIIVIGLVGVSAGISWLAFGWHRVHQGLIYFAETRNEARDEHRDAMRDPGRDEVRDFARDEGRDEQRDPARDAARDVPRDEDRDVQRDVQRDPRRDTARDTDMDPTNA